MRREVPNVLVVDGGDFIARQDRESEKSSIQLEIAAEFMLEAMDRMGYAAANLGEGDLVFGDAFLLGLLPRMGFPLLASSLLESYDWPLPAFTIVPVGGMRVGIVGVLSERFRSYVAGHSDPGCPMDLMPTRGGLDRGMERLIWWKADLKVLLLHAPFDEIAPVLKKALQGYDLVIAAHDSDTAFIAEPQIIAGSRVVQVGWDGKTIGRLDLHLDRDGSIIDVRGTSTILDESWPDHPDMLALHDAYLERVAGAIDRILEDYPVEPPPSGGRFVGSEPCKPCHESEWSRWGATQHPLATKTLVDRRRDYDPECFPCHTTGFRYEGGFRLISQTPQMGGVQCEACHGAGADHCAAPALPYHRPDEATCRTCHLPLHSPDFDYATYRAKILHVTP